MGEMANQQKVGVIIVAAGRGERMGGVEDVCPFGLASKLLMQSGEAHSKYLAG